MSNEPTSLDFDPYHKWLAIPKHMRPPTHYQLLGVAAGESDPEVIEEAAIRQTTHVRGYQVGPHADVCTSILNEIALARQVLANPEKKKAYDRQLPRESAARSGDAVFETESRRPNKRRDREPESRPSSRMPYWIMAAAGGGTLLIGFAVILAIVLTRPTEEPRVAVEPRPKAEPPAKAEPKPAPPKVAEIEPRLVIDPGPLLPPKILTPVDLPPMPLTPAPPMPVRPPKKTRPLDPPAIALANATRLVGVWTHKAPVAQYNVQQAQLTIREVDGGYALRLEAAGKNQKLAGADAVNLRFENGRLAFDLPSPIPRLLGDSGLIELNADDSLKVTYRNSKSSTTTVPMRFVRAEK